MGKHNDKFGSKFDEPKEVWLSKSGAAGIASQTYGRKVTFEDKRQKDKRKREVQDLKEDGWN